MPIQNPEVADLLEIDGESRFEIEVYRDAAPRGRTLAHGDFGARLT